MPNDFEKNKRNDGKMELKNSLREKMVAGEKTLGTFHELGSAAAVELLAYHGMDYIIIDAEHGPHDVESSANLIRAAKLAGTTPLVRTKDGERNSILKMLDVGAMGLVIPNIQTVEEVEKVIEYGKYYPVGNRGVAPAGGSHFWTQDYAKQGLPHLFELANREQLIIPQCETVGALENIEEIVALDGVDGIFVGPFDLSTALGKPGQIDDPEVKEAIQRVADACKAAGKFSFIYGTNVENSKQRFEEGYQSVTMTMDALIFGEAVKNVVNEIVG